MEKEGDIMMIKRRKNFKESVWELEPEDWNVVNTEDSNNTHHYGVKVWSGRGYKIEPFSVWAESPEDALSIVGDWCKENATSLVIPEEEVTSEINNWMVDEISKNPEEYGVTEDDLDLDDQEICDIVYDKDVDSYWVLRDKVCEENHLDEWIYETDNGVYLRAENLFVEDWPNDYPDPEIKEESFTCRCVKKIIESSGKDDISDLKLSNVDKKKFNEFVNQIKDEIHDIKNEIKKEEKTSEFSRKLDRLYDKLEGLEILQDCLFDIAISINDNKEDKLDEFISCIEWSNKVGSGHSVSNVLGMII